MSLFTTTATHIASKYTEYQISTLSLISIGTSVISLVSCLIIILCYILFKELRKLAYAFVFYMSISTSLLQCAKILGGHFEYGDVLCTIQGFLLTYCGLATLWWIMSIAIMMYTMIFHPFIWFNKEETISKCNKFSLIINYTLPLLFASLPFLFTNGYHPTGGWCWIEGVTTEGKILRWVTFYAQLVIILLFCIFMYIRICYYLKMNGKDLKGIHTMYTRIKWYPLCLILAYSVATVKRFIELWDVSFGFGWNVAQALTTGLFGFYIFIVYGRIGKLHMLFKKKYNLILCAKSYNVQSKNTNETVKAKTRSRTRMYNSIETTDYDQNLPLDEHVKGITEQHEENEKSPNFKLMISYTANVALDEAVNQQTNTLM